MSSAVAVHANGLELAFQWSMYSWICLTGTVTEVKVPRRMDWRVMMPNQVSIWLIQDEPTGVKWKCTCGLRSSHVLTSGVVWVDRLSSTTCTSAPACGLTAFLRKSRKFTPLRVGLHSPNTSPVATFNAANRLVVPCRT